MHLHFFEDPKTDRLQPLNLTRPTDDLRTGILSIREKWMHAIGCQSYSRNLKTYMEKVFDSGLIKDPENTIFINSRYLPETALLSLIRNLKNGQIILHSDDVVAFRTREELTDISVLRSKIPDDLEQIHYKEGRSIEKIWDLLRFNESEILSDLSLFGPSSGKLPDNLQHFGSHPVYIGEDVIIEPGAILISVDGPVHIGDQAHIEAGAILRGPVSIGEGSVVKMNARIYGASSIGPVCKVAGEISGSIFHSYSNKAHDGFVGDSIIGQWCNLGADTNTSNLKNNYGEVRVSDWQTKDPVHTGRQFLGTIMGDHSKTAINTMLNTGTITGVCANIFVSGFPPKMIPSFAWMGDNGTEVYDLEKASIAMAAMMKRRKITYSSEYDQMIRHIFENR